MKMYGMGADDGYLHMTVFLTLLLFADESMKSV